MPAVPSRARFSFWCKAALTGLLIVLADHLAGGGGSVVGVFALAWAAAVVAAHRAPCRHAGARTALLAAFALAAVQFEQPGLLAFMLFCVALATAVILPRARFLDAWRWSLRLILHGVAGLAAPFADARRALALRRAAQKRIGKIPTRFRWLGVLALPVIGGGVFLALFSAANPLISGALARLRLPDLSQVPDHAPLWLATLLAVWATLRPRRLRLFDREKVRPLDLGLPQPGVLSLTLALVVFNAVFALQNGLDIAFLWSGAPLPDGMTLADYAHRGAYPLIATALLAGAFVLVVLRPGSPGAAQPWIRRMVVLWVAQNVLLVASSALRTVDYIEVYSLTRLRLAALMWMGLVAVGLVLICWRLLRGRSGAWLINANAVAALAVLSACTVIDLGAVAAAWNVRHAREVGGAGAALDVCYLNSLGPSALVSVAELERRPLPPELADRITWLRVRQAADLARAQSDPRAWTWRGARRLARAEAISPNHPGPIDGGSLRDCSGALRSASRLTPPRQAQ